MYKKNRMPAFCRCGAVESEKLKRFSELSAEPSLHCRIRRTAHALARSLCAPGSRALSSIGSPTAKADTLSRKAVVEGGEPRPYRGSRLGGAAIRYQSSEIGTRLITEC